MRALTRQESYDLSMRLVAIFLAVSLCACGYPLKKRDWAIQGALAAISVTDGFQTRMITHDNDEENPFVGSRGQYMPFWSFGLLAFATEFIVATALPERYRVVFESLALGAEGSVVYSNLLNGFYPWLTPPSPTSPTSDPIECPRYCVSKALQPVRR